MKLFKKKKSNVSLLLHITIAMMTLSSVNKGNAQPQQPNFIIIFMDDLGYGDLGCYGSIIHQTPNIDKLAAHGIRFTDFYVSAPVCTPSRASLMTGCYPQRVDLHVNEKSKDEFRAVLTPQSPKGLNPDEITIAEIVKNKGYQTACIGKWHLGDQKPYWPTHHGFDYFYGILHSHNQGTDECPLTIFENHTAISSSVDFSLLTQKMTEKSIEFIRKNKENPFFLYLPHPMPHFPLAASDRFKGTSRDGIYGDAIAEIDWSVGEIVKVLEGLNLLDNTMIIFTSDNGGEGRGGMVKGGLNHPLRGHKGQTWEGGMRVPCIIHWPDFIEKGNVCRELVTVMDFLPTVAAIVDARDAMINKIDGHDISPLLRHPESEKSPYEVFYYYDREQLQAIRWKNWKLHLAGEVGRYPASWKSTPQPFPEMQLYNLDNDMTETWNVAHKYPDVVKKMNAMADSIRMELGDYDFKGAQIRKAGWVEHPECYQSE